jgi:4,5-DOPA dioxygenase extradiol
MLVATPHWESTEGFLVEASPRPTCLHDFYGFPRRLYEVSYEPPGDPAIAKLLIEEGRRRKLDVSAVADRGIDHGAWATLLHVAPAADIPVVTLSITSLPPEDHVAWGAAIRAAVERSGRRVAIVGTGSIAHRLDKLDMSGRGHWAEGERIEREILDLILARKDGMLARFDPDKWMEVAPEGNLAPLFIVLGAVGREFTARLVAYEQAFGSVGMAIVEFVGATTR